MPGNNSLSCRNLLDHHPHRWKGDWTGVEWWCDGRIRPPGRLVLGIDPTSDDPFVGIFRQDPVTGAWSPAVPEPWREEHSLLARLIFWVRGVEHCSPTEGVHTAWAERIARRGH